MIISEKYLAEVIKKYKDKPIIPEMIKKDLALSYILQEIGKHKEENENSPFHKLIFKGGTLLSKAYLGYHRISEDLDFIYRYNSELDKLSANQRKIRIKSFIKDELLPELNKICKKYNFDFDSDEINRIGENKYCPAKYPKYLMTLKIYINMEESNPIKLDINFCDVPFYEIKKSKIIHLNKLSEHLIYPLESLDIEGYGIDEIIIEKLRAIITREWIKERDIYDLFLISKLGYNIFEIKHLDLHKKIQQGIGYQSNKKNAIKHVLEIRKRLAELENNLEREIKDMNLVNYHSGEYREFFERIKKFILEINFERL